MNQLPDIAGLNYPQLNELRTQIEARMTDMRETGAAQLLTRFEEEAAQFGLSLPDIMANGKRKRGRPNSHKEKDAD